MNKRKKKVTMESIIDKSMREIHSLGHGLRWEQTPEEKKAYELRQKKEKKFSAKCDAERAKQIKRFNGSAWDKIETCPTKIYEPSIIRDGIDKYANPPQISHAHLVREHGYFCEDCGSLRSYGSGRLCRLCYRIRAAHKYYAKKESQDSAKTLEATE